MRTVSIKMAVPEAMTPYLDDMGQEASYERNAMLLYPYIKKGLISHGRAAEILGSDKWTLIEFYNSIGIPYLNQSSKDLAADVATFDRIKGKLQ